MPATLQELLSIPDEEWAACEACAASLGWTTEKLIRSSLGMFGYMLMAASTGDRHVINLSGLRALMAKGGGLTN
jgi:hypothetical protein